MKKSFFHFFLMFLLIVGSIHFVSAQRKNRDDDSVKQKNLAQAEYYFSEGMKYYILESYAKAIDFFQRSLEINPANSGGNYTIGEAYARLGKYDIALKYAEKALKIDPTNKYCYLLVAQLYEQQKKFPQAVKVYLDLIKKLPETDEYYFELAILYIQESKYDDALKVYDKIEKKFGVSDEISLQKQKIYLKNNKLDLAIEEGKKLIAAYPGEDRYVIMQAEMLVSNKRTQESISLLENLLLHNPDNAEARVILAEILRDKGDNSKADQEMEKAFKNKDLSAESKVRMLAEYLQKMPNDEKGLKTAKNLAELLIKTHPDQGNCYAAYGAVLKVSGETSKARDMYVKATEMGISDFEVWKEVVDLDAQLNDVNNLIKHSDQALTLYPTNAVFFYFSGLGHLIQKNYREAVSSLEQGKALSTGNTDVLNQINAMLGDAYNGVNEHKKSDDAYDEVLKNDPDNAGVLNNYSYYLSLRKEKLEQAKQMSARLVEKNPENSSYLDTYAWVLYTLKDFQGARKFLEKAIRFNAENGTIIEHYGDVLFKLGEKEKAVEQWIKAKKAGETSTMIDRKIADKTLYEK